MGISFTLATDPTVSSKGRKYYPTKSSSTRKKTKNMTLDKAANRNRKTPETHIQAPHYLSLFSTRVGVEGSCTHPVSVEHSGTPFRREGRQNLETKQHLQHKVSHRRTSRKKSVPCKLREALWTTRIRTARRERGGEGEISPRFAFRSRILPPPTIPAPPSPLPHIPPTRSGRSPVRIQPSKQNHYI